MRHPSPTTSIPWRAAVVVAALPADSRAQGAGPALRELAQGLGWAAGATLLAWFLLMGLLWARRQARQHLERWHPGDARAAPWAEHLRAGLEFLLGAVAWVLGLLLADAWLGFVLRQFEATRPWGERSTNWLLEVLGSFGSSAAAALPDLLVAVLIFVIARGVTRTNALLLRRVERGDASLGWIDADTAGPTRRLANGVVWLFALAMAYPYLPGSGSEAFKGVTVLAGLMLSLGASGVVGQVLAGFGVMYARLLRVGEYVRVGEVEGTVTGIGLFATQVQTGMGELVSLPNTVVFSQPIRNFSRLVDAGRFTVHTAVTIGYATPWRQVHAMLLEAATRTPGLATTPPPYVVQTALSDFYVEYRLCAQGNQDAPARRSELVSRLHGHIQDVFNENGVQIMSPHYRADPPVPQVVPPGPWSSSAP